ncbi:TRAP transporter small permease subunit [Roseomonas marmotae]|uniref:TRAP transporter small permease protein n=1 Tax=Roseomonas marmotae TaxID=2768161 RepID=A0ABS3KFE8_9PROT|nr:TRAP transporter small permease subunit [Roseomonas marmotae]MBO1076152.1 TRAP transporter small permease subunit [Roseomonas marmotae]QTI81811.1 TRAP transporter small permease subunit [Roseomonas marmotae]
MGPFLAYSRAMDKVSGAFGWVAEWMVFAACVISAGNAIMRYTLNYSSNGWLEVQWYLFAGTVMLGASYTLLRNEHVRVDLVFGAVSPRAKLWVDVFGITFFLLPAMALLTWMTWPFFLDAFLRNEQSSNAGGLVRWPAKIVLPVGFLLLVLQGLSELIKRIALLRGIQPPTEVVTTYTRPDQ